MLIAYMQHFNTLHITFMHYGHRNKTKEEKKPCCDIHRPACYHIKPLTLEVNNVDHYMIMQGSVWKPPGICACYLKPT